MTWDICPRGNNKTELNEKWQNYYDVVLPKLILEATEAFDDGVLIYTESPLIDKIERNLNECQTDKQKERYIFFTKTFSEISSIYCPTATVNRQKKIYRTVKVTGNIGRRCHQIKFYLIRLGINLERLKNK